MVVLEKYDHEIIFYECFFFTYYLLSRAKCLVQRQLPIISRLSSTGTNLFVDFFYLGVASS